jgi:hypothetical protein
MIRVLGVGVLAELVLLLGCGTGSEPHTATQQSASLSGNPTVLPPGSRPHGKSYPEWEVAWWNWAVSLPADAHPLLDTADCSAGQKGKVWFLGGSFAAQTVNRNCTIPNGTALFFPVVNSTDGAESPPDPVATARAFVDGVLATATDLSAEIDGVPVENLSDYLFGASSSPVFDLTLIANNIFGIPPGTYPDFVTGGVYLFLPPLAHGEHTLHFHGAFTGSSFTLDVTYHLTVGPRG